MLDQLITDLDALHVVETGDVASGNELALSVAPETAVNVTDLVDATDVADLAL